MGLVVVVMSLVALSAVATCALALVLMARMHASMLALVSETSRSKDDLVSRAHGSIGMALTEAATRTATAIGEAVQKATTLHVEPPSTHDAAWSAAREYVAGDTAPRDPEDIAVDPTDRFYTPDRQDLAMVAATQRNPTGIPGFAFDLPDWPEGLNIPVPSNGGNAP